MAFSYNELYKRYEELKNKYEKLKLEYNELKKQCGYGIKKSNKEIQDLKDELEYKNKKIKQQDIYIGELLGRR